MSPVQKKKNRAALPVVFISIGLLLVVAAVIWVLPQNPKTSTPAPQALATENTYPEIQRVGLADARAAFDNGTAVFVDVRDAASYSESHVTGALSIPLAELEGRKNELTRSQWIITYCT
jgi:3-mercaptopyruvate sulfurtransferase SseA